MMVRANKSASRPRRKSKAAKREITRPNLASVSLLVVGIISGVLATLLWQGISGSESGIRRIVQNLAEPDSRAQTADFSVEAAAAESAPRKKPSTDYTFFTVLPEIEIVAESPEPTSPTFPPPATAATTAETSSATAAENVGSGAHRETQTEANSLYRLQAGSYKRREDADQLKARLALLGMVSSVQKVSIQGRGDFYRVRLGPYDSYRAMAQADERLKQHGFQNTLRLKMVQSGG